LSVAENGDTLLQIEPRVRHGALGKLPHLAKDGQTLEVTSERPEEQFPALACELTLTPSDYVVIGAFCDTPFTLGYTAFVEPEKNQQFVLVIRTPRARPIGQSMDKSNGGAAPLAIQSLGSAPAPISIRRGQQPE
jgi:hypothetical protein